MVVHGLEEVTMSALSHNFNVIRVPVNMEKIIANCLV